MEVETPATESHKTLIAGVTAELSEHLQLVIINELSNDLKEHIRKFLVDVCRGPSMASMVPGWDYPGTIKELNKRISKKDRNGRIGMVGELLTHVLAPFLLPDLRQTSVYFNKEDRSVKKGFDLTFYEESRSRIWYAEVKSGEPAETESPIYKASSLLKKASRDLIEMLTAENRRSLWDSAIIDVSLTLGQDHVPKLSEILNDDADETETNSDWDKHVILTANVFSDVQKQAMTTSDISEILDPATQLNDRFREEIWLVFHKSTFEAVIGFIEDEARE